MRIKELELEAEREADRKIKEELKSQRKKQRRELRKEEELQSVSASSETLNPHTLNISKNKKDAQRLASLKLQADKKRIEELAAASRLKKQPSKLKNSLKTCCSENYPSIRR